MLFNFLSIISVSICNIIFFSKWFEGSDLESKTDHTTSSPEARFSSAWPGCRFYHLCLTELESPVGSALLLVPTAWPHMDPGGSSIPAFSLIIRRFPITLPPWHFIQNCYQVSHCFPDSVPSCPVTHPSAHIIRSALVSSLHCCLRLVQGLASLLPDTLSEPVLESQSEDRLPIPRYSVSLHFRVSITP